MNPERQILPGNTLNLLLNARIMRNLVRKIPSGALAAFGVRFGAAALAYLLQVVLARSLGAAEFGTFSFAWSLVSIGGFLATLGFSQIAVRFLAEYQERGDSDLARGFVRRAFIATLTGSALATGLAYALFPLIEHGYGPAYRAVLAIGLLALPLLALSDLLEGFARSQGWTFRALAPAYLVRSSILLAGLGVTLWAGQSMNAPTAMLIALGATLAATTLQLRWVMPTLLRLFPQGQPRSQPAEWYRAAGPTFLSDLAVLARQNVDLIVLGLLAPAAVVGVYFAATRLASLVGLVEFAVGAVYGHRFARGKLGGAEAESAAFRQAQRLMCGLGWGVAVALALAAPTILRFFGAGFEAAHGPVLILLAGAAVRMGFGPLEDRLAMAGFPADVWRANRVGALLTAGLCLALAGPWQATGAAIGASLGGLASTLLLSGAWRRRAAARDLSASEARF